MTKPVETVAGPLWVSKHAVDRYVERVKPALTPKHAHWEMARVLSHAEVVNDLPEWCGSRPEEVPTDFYLVLCGSICFPVHEGWIKTTLTRGSLPPLTRERRNENRRAANLHRFYESRHKNSRSQTRSKVRRDLGEAA